MTVLRLVLLISLVALTARGQQNSPQQPSAPRRFVPPASCPVTVPPAVPFTPPSSNEPGANSELDENDFWLGTEKLWTALGKSGVWEWAPHGAGHEHEVQPLTVKTFWWSRDFNYKEEYPPELKVTGRRLDGFAPALLTLRPTTASRTTNPRAPIPSSKLLGYYHPSALRTDDSTFWAKPPGAGSSRRSCGPGSFDRPHEGDLMGTGSV
jgi:hypothetical protein